MAKIRSKERIEVDKEEILVLEDGSAVRGIGFEA